MRCASLHVLTGVTRIIPEGEVWLFDAPGVNCFRILQPVNRFENIFKLVEGGAWGGLDRLQIMKV